MRISADRMSQINRLMRRIEREGNGKPMVVFLDAKGAPDCCLANNGRHLAMADSAEWSQRIKGVFCAGVTPAALAKALFHGEASS